MSVLLLLFVIQTNRLSLHFQTNTRCVVECVRSDPSPLPSALICSLPDSPGETARGLPLRGGLSGKATGATGSVHRVPCPVPCLRSAWRPGLPASPASRPRWALPPTPIVRPKAPPGPPGSLESRRLFLAGVSRQASLRGPPAAGLWGPGLPPGPPPPRVSMEKC